jgi:hypothetical protein
MKRPYFRVGVLITCIYLLISCGSIQNSQNQRIQDQMEASLRNCINSASKGSYSRCVLTAYNDANRMSNSNPSKPATLKYLSSMYELTVKLDRGQISNQQDLIIAGNRIYNQYLADFQAAQIRSAEANAAASMRQQQMFMNAYRLLTPNGTGGVNCYPIQGGPSFGPTAGGMVCQ